MLKGETRAEYATQQLTDLGVNELPTRRGGREQRRGAEAVPTTASAPAGRGSTDDHECYGTDDLFETKTKKAKRVAASTIRRRPKKRPCTPARQPSPTREVSPVPELLVFLSKVFRVYSYEELATLRPRVSIDRSQIPF